MKSSTLTSLLALALIGGCARSNAPMATDADAVRARQRWPGITISELNTGRKLYVGHCGTCHLPPRPGDFAPDAWPGHVREMQERSGLDAASGLLVERYVITMAIAATAP